MKSTLTYKSIFRFISQIFTRIAAIVAFTFRTLMILLILGLLILFAKQVPEDTAPLPKEIILKVDLNGPLLEQNPDQIENLFFKDKALYLQDVLFALRAASTDDSVKGFVLHAGPENISLAQSQELHSAVRNFRKSGKFTHFYTDSFGELTPANGLYHLATAFDHIAMQPIGFLGLTGLAVESPFAKDGLKKIGLKAEFSTRAEYKTAASALTEKNMSNPHREMLRSILDDLTDQLVNNIARSRGLREDDVRQAINDAPLTAEEALIRGLVDQTTEDSQQDDPTVPLLRYLDAVQEKARHEAPPEQPVIALLYAGGTITRQSRSIASSNITEAQVFVNTIEEVLKDEDVKAIVIRVNSPGGSAVASDTIRRALQKAQETVPVIVSMGDVAASGGYWISMNANTIIALPATLTGSIGVLGGKIVAEELWDKLGINWTQITRGDNAALWSPSRSFTHEQKAHFDKLLDYIYTNFTRSVAAARNLPEDHVESIAKGRVWTGRQALENGLVDALGGLEDALEHAHKVAQLPVPARIQVYPRPRPLLEQFRDLTGEFTTTRIQLGTFLQIVAPVLNTIRPFHGTNHTVYSEIEAL